jgi:hypothetical protein
MVRAYPFALIGCLAGCNEDHNFVTDPLEDSSAGEESPIPSYDFGGGAPVDPEDLDDRPTVVANPPPPPVLGGAITVHSDGRTVFVSDPDRDLVHIVDLVERRELVAVEFPRGAIPWRAVEDPAGRVHVALRGRGQIATFDAGASSPSIADVCPTPRGLAVGPDATTLVVACAGGELVELSLDDRRILRSVDVAPDLRDVIIEPDGEVHVTRFRRADVLTLDASYRVIDERPMHSWPAFASSAAMKPSTAWRAVAYPGGGWLVAHQAASDAEIESFAGESSPPPYYGGSQCGELVQSTLSLWTPAAGLVTIGALRDIALPVDVAVTDDGRHAVVVGAVSCPPPVPPDPDDPAPIVCTNAQIVDVGLFDAQEADGGCADAEAFDRDVTSPEAQMIAVAHAPDHMVLVQQREPAQLMVIEREIAVLGTSYRREAIPLGGRSIEDTGDRLFHEITPSRLACASCHPEGGDDGHVWRRPEPRHTPALYVGLAGTEPFHWTGDIVDYREFIDDVFVARMGGRAQPGDRADAFERWVTGLRTQPPADPMTSANDRGHLLFIEHCESCHAGDATTNSETVSLDGLPPLQVPSLHAVGLHPPYMHDGRAEGLAEAVRDMLERTGSDEPAQADVDDLVAHLRTL